MQFLKR